jgi:hypothetical protein
MFTQQMTNQTHLLSERIHHWTRSSIKCRITCITRTCMYVVEVKYYMYTCIYGLAFLRTFGNMHSWIIRILGKKMCFWIINKWQRCGNTYNIKLLPHTYTSVLCKWSGALFVNILPRVQWCIRSGKRCVWFVICCSILLNFIFYFFYNN